MSAEQLLRTIFAQAADILKETLLAYWPSEGNAEISEATTLLAVAHALRGNGFLTYAEVQVADARNQHIDLFAFSTRSRLAVAIEGKRLFQSDGARTLLGDWNRLHSARLASEYGRLSGGLRSFAAVVATTWDPGIRAWWDEPQDSRRASVWNEFARAIGGATRGQVEIQHDLQWGWGHQHLLYAFQERSTPFMS